MKSILKKTAKNLGLVPAIDYLRSRLKGLKQTKKNRSFLEANPSFIPPPLELAYDAYGNVNWEFYYQSGLADASLFGNLILQYAPKHPLNILDWGCGPARILAYLPKILSNPNHRIYGTDYNPNTIKWCKKNIKGISFAINDLLPPLIYENEKFDAIYGLSILTHLSEKSHYEWVRELDRVLKPNGIIILTTHGDRFRNALTDAEKKQYDAERLVERNQINEGRRGFATFHPPKFLREKLFSIFNILAHIDVQADQEASLTQDVWVLQKKS